MKSKIIYMSGAGLQHALALLLPWLLAAALLPGCSQSPKMLAQAGKDTCCPPKEKAEPAGAEKICSEHNVPLAQCGICSPERAKELKPGESLKIRLPSADSAMMTQIKVSAPGLRDSTEGVDCYAEIVFNQNKLAQVTAPVGGLIQTVDVDLGNMVKDQQVLAQIWSATIAEAIAKAVLTHQTLERERKLRADRVTPEKELQQAEAAHRAACQQLRTLGFTEEQVDDLGHKPQESVYMNVRAPFAGEIVERSAVRGALVEAGKQLFTLADRSTMWAILNLPETALLNAAVGQPVEIQVDSLPGKIFKGTLTWISAEIDEHTRMARARAEIPNPTGQLKARMFARAKIQTGASRKTVLLPHDAIQRIDGRPFVFVKEAEDLFAARAVRLGSVHPENCEIVEGLGPDEPVAMEHSFALKSQFLISRLGAGCADD